jgi:hypothetical protein
MELYLAGKKNGALSCENKCWFAVRRYISQGRSSSWRRRVEADASARVDHKARRARQSRLFDIFVRAQIQDQVTDFQRLLESSLPAEHSTIVWNIRPPDWRSGQQLAQYLRTAFLEPNVLGDEEDSHRLVSVVLRSQFESTSKIRVPLESEMTCDARMHRTMQIGHSFRPCDGSGRAAPVFVQ